MTRVDSSLPTNGVTFLLTDVEGSTRAWQAAPESMTAPVARHYEILDAAIVAHNGQRPQEQGEGDSVVAVFHTAAEAVAAALDAQLALRDELPNLPVRMALHGGDAMLRDEHNYVGLTIIRCARIRSCGHGQQILLSDDTAREVAGSLPAETSVADLGVYGLRDLAGRERIWQLTHPRLPSTFPPLKAGASVAGNLPSPISSFVGRGADLAALSHLIAQHRLVSIVGETGVGKSRVAIAAAGAAAGYLPGGVWWVPLAGNADNTADAVLAAVAQSCAIERVGDDHMPAIIDHFRSVADALIVVDGSDHPGVADATAQLLAQCPSVRIVMTGRHALRIAGEAVHVLAPLGTPPDSFTGGRRELDTFDAARLFIDRATTAGATARFDDAEATTVAHICRVLGGLPLGLELAAARSASTSLAQLVSSLGALTAAPALGSAGTLASSIAWSYQLLTPDEQTTIRRLGVFIGDFEIDAATMVAVGGGLDEAAAALAINGLLDQRLLAVDEKSGRLAIPLAVRQFAHARLVTSPDFAATVAHHGEWFAAVAERFAAAGQAMPVSLLAPDEADLMAALEAAMGTFDPSVAYRIIGGIGVSWSSVDHHEMLARVTAWVSGRSPSDGEERWAAAVARLCFVHALQGDNIIHTFADEARAIAEIAHDDDSQLVLDAAIVAADEAARTAPTVSNDMAWTT